MQCIYKAFMHLVIALIENPFNEFHTNMYNLIIFSQAESSITYYNFFSFKMNKTTKVLKENITFSRDSLFILDLFL